MKFVSENRRVLRVLNIGLLIFRIYLGNGFQNQFIAPMNHEAPFFPWNIFRFYHLKCLETIVGFVYTLEHLKQFGAGGAVEIL